MGFHVRAASTVASASGCCWPLPRHGEGPSGTLVLLTCCSQPPAAPSCHFVLKGKHGAAGSWQEPSPCSQAGHGVVAGSSTGFKRLNAFFLGVLPAPAAVLVELLVVFSHAAAAQEFPPHPEPWCLVTEPSPQELTRAARSDEAASSLGFDVQQERALRSPPRPRWRFPGCLAGIMATKANSELRHFSI